MRHRNTFSTHGSILIRTFGDSSVRKSASRLVHEAIVLVGAVRKAYARARRAEHRGERSALPQATASAVKVSLAARSALRKT
jgi:hypothetical protein